MPDAYRFEGFVLDPANRRLERGGAPVEINGRYLDALALLVREAGRLVSKDRFMDEVWRGIPVTDEALTQCIRALRRQLGDDAAAPRFIATVPKHGYRFIAAVEPVGADEAAAPAVAAAAPPAAPSPAAAAAAMGPWQRVLLLGSAGTLGAGVAGIFGGLFYGFAGAADPLAPGMGSMSVLLVLLCLTLAAALVGGAGVAFGIAAARAAAGRGSLWIVAGGAVGGLIVGAFGKLLGLDAFNLLLGRSPGEITGGPEGALLGAAVGFGAWLGSRGIGRVPLRRSVAIAGAAGALAGILIPLLGGRLMGGSLDLLARGLPGSRLRLDRIGALVGEQGFDPVAQTATGALEGGLFAAFLVGAMILGERSLRDGG